MVDPLQLRWLAIVFAAGIVPHAFDQTASAATPRPYGLIEVGGSGVKYVALRASAEDCRLKVEILGSKDVQTSAILLKDGKLAPARIKDTARESAVIYFEYLRGLHKIPANRIRVALSSAFGDVPNVGELEAAISDAIRNPQKYEIIPPAGITSPTGSEIPFDRVTVSDELAYLIRGLGRGERGRSVLVDIGSGNVKCGYFVEDGEFTLPGFHVLLKGPFGAKQLSGMVKKKTVGKPAATYLAELDRAGKEFVSAPLAECADANAGLLNREKYYLLGGSVWAMVTLLFPESVADREELVKLTPADIERYVKLVTTPDDEGKLRPPVINLERLEPAIRLRSDQEIRRVLEVFNPEQLAAGAVILREVSETLDLNDRRKTLYTMRNSQFTWATAFLKTIAEKELLSK